MLTPSLTNKLDKLNKITKRYKGDKKLGFIMVFSDGYFDVV